MGQLRHLTIISILLVTSLVTPPRPRAAAGDVLPFQATERTLGNGLKVIVVRTGFPNLVSIQIPVQVGSRNEVEPGKSGFAQLFEIWIRPVVPVNAHMTLRIAIHELDLLIRNGLTKEDFTGTRDYLMNNVYVMTARQDQQLGYALDSQWYGIGEFADVMRKAVQTLTVEEVNAALKRHLDARNLSIVYVTKDAAGLKQALASDAFSPIRYDGEKSADVLAEDKLIGALKLNIAAENIVITPIDQVFAK